MSKNSVLIFIFALFSTSLLFSLSNHSIFRGNIEQTGVYNTKSPEKLNVIKWKFKTNGFVLSSPVSYRDQIYFGSNDGYIYALNIESGKELFKFKAGKTVQSTPLIHNELIYFESDNILYVLDLKGNLKWKYIPSDLKSEELTPWDDWDYYHASPVIIKDKIYFASASTLYSLDLKGNLIWKFKSEAFIRGTPCSDGQNLYFGDYSGLFFAVNINNGEKIWSLKFDDSVVSSPAYYEGLVYFGSRDCYFYGVEAKTGKIIWKYSVYPSWASGTPAIADGVLYVGGSDSKSFYALDAKNGEKKWKLRCLYNIFCGAVVSGSNVYFTEGDSYDHANGNGYIHVADINTGLEKSKARFFGIFSTPLVLNGVIYFGSNDGYFYALSDN